MTRRRSTAVVGDDAPDSVLPAVVHSPLALTTRLPFGIADDPELRGTKVLAALFANCQSENTRRAYADDFANFRRFLEQGYREKLSPAQTVDRLLFGAQKGQTHAGHAHALASYYHSWLSADGKASATIRRRLVVLKNIVATARRIGLLAWSLELKGPKHQQRRDTAGPGVAVVAAMLETLQRDAGPMATRDAAIIRLLFDVALRRAEVAALSMGDLDLADGRIRIKGKGRSEPEWITIPPPTVAALSAWLAHRGTEAGPVFLCFTPRGQRAQPARLSGHGIYRLVRGYGLDVGRKVWPHGLRHSAITAAVDHAAKHGVSLLEVRQFSRHASINQLQTYYDAVRNMQGTLAGAVADTVLDVAAPASEPDRPTAPENLDPAARRMEFKQQLAKVKARYRNA